MHSEKSEAEALHALDELFSAVSQVATASGAAELSAPAALAGLAARRVLKMTTERPSGFGLRRLRQIELAYTILPYVAFFEAFDEALPEIQRALGAVRPEGPHRARQTQRVADRVVADWTTVDINFPLPEANLATLQADVVGAFKLMTEAVHNRIAADPNWGKYDSTVHAEVGRIIHRVPPLAAARWRGTFFELALTYDEFWRWANLTKVSGMSTEVGALRDRFDEFVLKDKESRSRLDVGFASLSNQLQRLPEAAQKWESDLVLEGLAKIYRATVSAPVVKRPVTSDKGTLRFPNKKAIYIPPAFRWMRVDGEQSGLGDDRMWGALPLHADLAPFLLRHLDNPVSTENVLLILGLPGSGKSLLAEVLSSELMGSRYIPILIPLRAVNAEADVQTQIQQAIRAHTRHDVNWARFVAGIGELEPVLIFDGLDELLQASSKTYFGYLEGIRNFLTAEKMLSRPSRAIVTSRTALIDKANVPLGTTVVQLQPFDKERQDRWITKWNETNHEYFLSEGVRPFRGKLPRNISHLSSQPLLLLLLAIYDAKGNALERDKDLDAVLLYHRLIRQFLEREYEERGQAEPKPKQLLEHLVDEDFGRLGVTALGMVNRKSLFIREAELEHDLGTHERRVSGLAVGVRQADIVLNRFFFVYASRAIDVEGGPAQAREVAAYEFLHATFAEFLAAEYLVRIALQEALVYDAIRRANSGTPTRNRHQPSPSWFDSLGHVLLFERPLVLQMAKAWLPHALAERNLSATIFEEAFRSLVSSQLNRAMTREGLAHLPADLPGRGPTLLPEITARPAVYTLNLVTLAACLLPSLIIARDSASAESTGWEKFAALWNSAIPLSQLAEISAILGTEHHQTNAVVRYSPIEYKQPLDDIERVHRAAGFLGDALLRAVSEIATLDPLSRTPAQNAELLRTLNENGLIATDIVVAADLRVRSQDVEQSQIGLAVRHASLRSRAALADLAVQCARNSLLVDQLLSAAENESGLHPAVLSSLTRVAGALPFGMGGRHVASLVARHEFYRALQWDPALGPWLLDERRFNVSQELRPRIISALHAGIVAPHLFLGLPQESQYRIARALGERGVTEEARRQREPVIEAWWRDPPQEPDPRLLALMLDSLNQVRSDHFERPGDATKENALRQTLRGLAATPLTCSELRTLLTTAESIGLVHFHTLAAEHLFEGMQNERVPISPGWVLVLECLRWERPGDRHSVAVRFLNWLASGAAKGPVSQLEFGDAPQWAHDVIVQLCVAYDERHLVEVFRDAREAGPTARSLTRLPEPLEP